MDEEAVGIRFRLSRNACPNVEDLEIHKLSRIGMRQAVAACVAEERARLSRFGLLHRDLRLESLILDFPAPRAMFAVRNAHRLLY